MSQSSRKFWQALVRSWRDADTALSGVATSSEIDDFQERFNVVLPSEVRDYFEIAGGMASSMDETGFRFWPIQEWLPFNDVLLPESQSAREAMQDCFAFADFMIDAEFWAIRLTRDSLDAPVLYFDQALQEGIEVAASFLEFFRRYKADYRNAWPAAD